MPITRRNVAIQSAAVSGTHCVGHPVAFYNSVARGGSAGLFLRALSQANRWQLPLTLENSSRWRGLELCLRSMFPLLPLEIRFNDLSRFGGRQHLGRKAIAVPVVEVVELGSLGNGINALHHHAIH